MKKNFLLYVILPICVLSLAFNGCAKKDNTDTSSNKSSTIKAGLVFDIGGRGDKSFNDAAYNGLERAKKELGIEFEVIDPGDGADRESALRKLAVKKDISIIFGVGFIFTDDITKMAKEFPDKKFACVDFSVDEKNPMPANLQALEFKEEEGSFLVGYLAALTTKTNKVGFLGGMESALIKKFETGYKQGVKFGKPDCEIYSAYVSVNPDGFKNPGKGKEICLSQFDKGADIIYHASGLSGLGLFEAAREKKKLGIGVDLDQYKEAPGFVLTSMVKMVDEAVFDAIKDLKNNTFKGGVKTLGLKDKGVDYVYDANNKSLIPDDVHKKVEDVRAKIMSGEIKVADK
ncbi:MAG: BMP family ABC transporter substrate-binding protein [Ignavibacteria bacterium]|nr:BMP family ABC transporter substrate-binding protein [Ignavibacteria bacterium]